jgi:hypothetical protein
METAVIETQQTITVVDDLKDTIVISEQNYGILSQQENIDIISVDNLGTVVHEEQIKDVIVQGGIQGPQGPQGPPGVSGEEDVPYSKRIDFVTENELYKGEAAVGSAETSTSWRIKKIVIAGDGDVAETWAGGTAQFDKTWSLRANYTYS